MDEDLENKITQIIGALKSQFSSDDGEGGENSRSQSGGSDSSGMSDDTLKMMMKMKSIMDGQSKKDDPAKNLLLAIKPFLRESRQERVGNCIKFLGMSKMAKYAELFNDK